MKVNPTEFDWTPSTANTDGTPLAMGEITGYEIGIRPASGIPGSYPLSVPIADPAATKEALTAAYAAGLAVLKDGDYQSAIRTVGPVDSAFTAESDASAFSIATPLPVPQAPTGFTLA